MRIFKKIKELFKRKQIKSEISKNLKIVCEINKLKLVENNINYFPFGFTSYSDSNRFASLEAWYDHRNDKYCCSYSDKIVMNKFYFETNDISEFNDELLKLPVLKQYLRDQKLKELLK